MSKMWFRVFVKLSRMGLMNWIPDSTYLKLRYYGKFGKKLDLNNPQTFNEKLQWLKLYNRKPIYSTMVDKYEAKKYVASIIGEEHIIPTLGVWNRFEDIDFRALPDQFVLKCTHDSGGFVICRSKKDLDLDAAKAKIEKCLKTSYFYKDREWPYKNVKPRIIAEQYISEENNEATRDYKFFCFGGQARCMKVDFDRFIEHRANYFDMEGNLLLFGEVICPLNPNKAINLPDNMKEMRLLVEKLASEVPSLRADFYDVSGKVYFGELIFFPMAGFMKLTDPKWDGVLGSWIKIPKGRYCMVLNNESCVVFNPKVRGLVNYKFYCLNSEVKYLQVSQGVENHKTAKVSFLTPDWQFAPFGRSDFAPFTELPEKPVCYKEMKEIARRLSEDLAFIRVDMYCVEGIIYFSELTFSPGGGYIPFSPPEYDKILGSQLILQ